MGPITLGVVYLRQIYEITTRYNEMNTTDTMVDDIYPFLYPIKEAIIMMVAFNSLI